jgi:pSer/pThr/pTyr-binding forkhead associated (FHA) protein
VIRKLIVSDGRGERELVLVGTIVVGRDPGCHVNDLDPLLSRRHAEFVAHATSATIRDLNSRNGILVNGAKVPHHTLQPGDVVQLGHLHVRYVEEPSAAPSPDEPNRAHATTATGSLPTMAVGQPAAEPARRPAPHDAPTESAPSPAYAPGDNDPTMVPSTPRAQASRATVPAPAPAPQPARPGADDDPDATRFLSAKVGPAVPTPDTVDITRPVFSDETRAPVGSAGAAAAAPVAGAQVVADVNLIVTAASADCHAFTGVRSETLIGSHLVNAVSTALASAARGGAPAGLTMSVVRGQDGRTITLTFMAGQPGQSS